MHAPWVVSWSSCCCGSISCCGSCPLIASLTANELILRINLEKQFKDYDFAKRNVNFTQRLGFSSESSDSLILKSWKADVY